MYYIPSPCAVGTPVCVSHRPLLAVLAKSMRSFYYGLIFKNGTAGHRFLSARWVRSGFWREVLGYKVGGTGLWCNGYR